MNRIKSYTKVIIHILILFISIISIADKEDPEKYRMHDPNETTRTIDDNVSKKETLIYNRESAEKIMSDKSWVVGQSLGTMKWEKWFYDSVLPLYGTTFRYKSNKIINSILKNNKYPEYNPNKFLDNSLDSITNLEDGISDINLIRLLYNTYYNEKNILNYNDLDNFYLGILDQFGQSTNGGWRSSRWNGSVPPKDSRAWKVVGDIQWNDTINPFNTILKRNDLHDINLSKLGYHAHYPYELNEDTISTVQVGDIIIVDLFDDGTIDFSGIAYIDDNDLLRLNDDKITNNVLNQVDSLFDISRIYDLNTTKWMYPVADIKLGQGYYTSGNIPITTEQIIQTKSTTSTGESEIKNTTITNRVVVIPSVMLMDSIWEFSKPLDYLEDLDPDLKTRLKRGEYIERLNIEDRVLNPIISSYEKPENFKPSYSIVGNQIKISEDAIKDIQEKNTSKNTTPFTPFQDDGGVNSMFNGIIEVFTDGLRILPAILIGLISSLFVLDLMFTALKEIKFANNGIESFMSVAFDKIVRYSMVLIMLFLYSEFLINIFYPFVISKLPVYILGLTDKYSYLGITTEVKGSTILHFPSIWWQVQSTILGSLASILVGRFWSAVFTIIFIFLSIWFFPTWTIRYIVIKIFVIAPFIVMVLFTSIAVAINTVANIFMSAIFMIIVTTLASIYFVFGVTDLYVDKFMLIIKILMVTMLQYLVQIMLLVTTLTTFKEMSKIIMVSSVGGLFDILPTAVICCTILLIAKIPTKISRTLEQAI